MRARIAWMGLLAVAAVAGMVGWKCVGVGAAQSEEAPKPKLSKAPLSEERVAVYHDFVAAWMGRDSHQLNLSQQTMPLEKDWAGDPEGCRAGLDLEPMAADEVHEFRAAEARSIGGATTRLVDPDAQQDEVRENDPWSGIKKGDTVEGAVRNGFNHGLFKLSEIQFDKGHEHAILKYSFICGRLCGDGGTVVLSKTKAGWKQTGTCGSWVS